MNTKFFSGVMDELIRKTTAGRGNLESANPSDKFAGTWIGTNHFANSSEKVDILIEILPGCKPGEVCGYLNNKTVDCIWEMTLDGINEDVLSYTFTKTLRGVYPASTVGKLILRSDGTLYRVHQTPGNIVSGSLSRE